jgi:hypothetical protein
MSTIIVKKENVDGIILVLSCQKHLNTRLAKCRLPKNEYGNWKVIYVIGDLSLNQDYKMFDNMMVIKCEDSYIHLLKKMILAIKYVYELYDIKEGILRSGDDLIYNEALLINFLNENDKPEFCGYNVSYADVVIPDINIFKYTVHDMFMVNYYLTHPEDFTNPQHNLVGVDINKYTIRPKVSSGVGGVLYFINNKCCSILVKHMEDINYNIFHFDEFTQSYPYTIEDCAVSFILFMNHITLTYNQMYTDYPSNNTIAYHTNMYK